MKIYGDKEKIEAISLIHDSRGTPVALSMLKLLDILIDEARERNDDSQHPEFLVNQGEIKGFKKLREYIEKDRPFSV